MQVNKRILPIIIFSQFAGTSLWFAGNAILPDLQNSMNVNINDTGIVTSAIQLGFITGTLIFAIFALSDRYSPRKIFLLCSIAGALSNLLIYLFAYNIFSLLALRFITGFFLTGIYPIGMKIAAGWYKKDLGNAIGLLVGALVLGTAFPHLLKSLGGSLPWEQVIIFVTVISIMGGFGIYIFVQDGPYINSGTRFNPNAIKKIFFSKDLRSAAFGYFGHMWELYTFWALIPIILLSYLKNNPTDLNFSFWSFIIIAAGSAGCIFGGMISRKTGSARVAFTQLLLSGCCCLLAPLMFSAPTAVFLLFLIFWGVVVAGDSPQYSAVIAQTAPTELMGSALTLVISIGFSVTILSLWVIFQFLKIISIEYALMILAIGPIAGLYSMRTFIFQNSVNLKRV